MWILILRFENSESYFNVKIAGFVLLVKSPGGIHLK